MSDLNEIIEKLHTELYEQHVTETDDVDFILSILGERPLKVLEVCCGSGRILVPLAKAGHDVTGFDMNQPMLDRITSKANGLENIQWHKADAVYDDWGTGFDVVLLAGNILFNIESDMDYSKAQELFIRKAAAALVPGGHVYIEYTPFAPNGRTLTKSGQSCDDDDSIIWSWDGRDSAGNFGKDSITKGAFDEETGILRFRRFFELTLADGQVIKKDCEKIKHYATLEQIHGWLSGAGFSIEFEYENFSKKPVHDESQVVILYAEKR